MSRFQKVEELLAEDTKNLGEVPELCDRIHDALRGGDAHVPHFRRFALSNLD